MLSSLVLQYENSIGQPGWFTSFLDRRPLTLGAMGRLIDREMDNEPAMDGFKKWLTAAAPNLERAIREQKVSVVVEQSNGYRHMAREIDCATARKLVKACLTILSSLYEA